MATVHLHGDTLEVRFTPAEKISGLLLRDVRIPTSAVRAVELVPDGLAATRGIRAPGLAIPGVRKIGTWRRRGGKSIVTVRRHQPAVRIDLAGQRYESLLIGLDRPEELAAELEVPH